GSVRHEALDPGTLSVTVMPASGLDPDAVNLDRLAPWLTVVEGRDAREHAVLSDGWRRIRVDVEAGTLREGGTVILAYRLRAYNHTIAGREYPPDGWSLPCGP
ncbi:hypothetical protein ACCS63_35090, partial [Rhizobium brockwellii]|uniref:hypothetical protein n=1 Tax=Rhizobium brockwellii TaxID=3019932 RepID=UPI003F97CE94